MKYSLSPQSFMYMLALHSQNFVWILSCLDEVALFAICDAHVKHIWYLIFLLTKGARCRVLGEQDCVV